MPADVRVLAERGLLRVACPGAWPLVEIGEEFTAVEELQRIRDERRGWEAASMSRWAAAEALGVSEEEFDRLAGDASIHSGRFGRYSRSQIMRLRASRSVCGMAGFGQGGCGAGHSGRRCGPAAMPREAGLPAAIVSTVIDEDRRVSLGRTAPRCRPNRK